MNTPQLPDKQYDIIYADPPWKYDRNMKTTGKVWTNNVQMHYPTMTNAEICAIPIKEIASADCLLFLWTTSPKLLHAIEVGHKWGFKFATIAFVWDKQRTVAGSYTMSQCELCLVFKRGKIPKPRGARNILQFLSEKRGKHSQKPNEVRERITEMFPEQSKIELFARECFDGWDAWGNEV